MILKRFLWLAALLGVIWGVQVVNSVTGYALNEWLGLRPRSFGGLDGIILMPLLHGSLSHTVANTIPLVILGGFLALSAEKVVSLTSVVIVVCCGLGVWLFGSNAIHVGASGLIFGWFGFLLTRGFVEKRMIPILVAVLVALIYGPMIWGILPGQLGISWESHLFGGAAGVLAALLLKNST